MVRLRNWIWPALLATQLFCAPIALSQEKNALLRIIVPYAAGGQSDLLARALAQSLTKTLDRSVIIENKVGAAALIGTRAVQTAAADGNTILFHNSGFVALPLLTKAVTYDPVRDFMPVAMVGYSPNYLMINGNIPARTLPEFIAWAKSQPDGIAAANSGLGSAGHLAAQLFAKRAGIKVVHVPYKGTAETQTALIAGEVQMQLTSSTEVISQQAKAGKVRLLAVNSRERTAMAPDIPTISETLPDFGNDVWFGFLAPAGSPIVALQRISDALSKALGESEIRERFAQNYMTTTHRDPVGFAKVISESLGSWQSMIAELGLEPK